MKPSDIQKIRAKLHLSQSAFAELLGVSKRTVENWEQGRNEPTAAAERLIQMAASGALTRKGKT